MSGPLYGKEFMEKLLFLPKADTDPKVQHEICEPALFRFLLNEKTIKDQAEISAMLQTLNCIDKLSKITKVETHQSSMGSAKDLGKAFHVFILLKTTSGKDGDYWWSLEKNTKYIVMQRSPKKNDVKEKLNGKERKRVQPIAVDLKGKGTIKDLFAILWVYEVIPEKYHIKYSNCQSLVTLVSKTITEIGYEYKGIFEYSPQGNDRNRQMLDFINILSMCFEKKGHPLFHLIYHEKPDLFDIVMKSGKYDINDTFTDHRMTPLHLAIVISSPEMVRHLLGHPEVNPRKCDRKGRTALHLAALYAEKNVEKIIDLLLEHINVNERDSDNGRTALHYAVCACNSDAVQHLMKKGADLDSIDNDGQSPLHLAACHKMGKYESFSRRGLDFGLFQDEREITDYLIKKRANINCRDKNGCTPLHLAAAFANDMEIIELLLANIEKEDIDKQYKNDENIFDYAKKNKNGLGQEIIARLQRKGIFGKKKDPTFSVMEDESNKTSDLAFNEKTEKEIETIIRDTKNEIQFFKTFLEAKRIFSNDRQKKKLSADTEVTYDTQIKIMLPLALENIIIESDVEKVRNLIDERKAISKVTWENGANALHVAAKWAKTTEMIDVIQENGKFDINGVDSNENTPIIYALFGTNPIIDREEGEYNKDIDLFDLFLKPIKIDINDSDKYKRPAWLINESNVTTTRYLIEKGADPYIANINGWTPFLLAAKYAKDLNIFRLLMVNKTVNIDVDCNDKDGGNALILLCRYYDQENLIDIVRLLIDRNIDVNASVNGKTNEGWNALLLVCRYYDKENLIDIVRLLIAKNIDVNCNDEDGDNALTVLCRHYEKENLIDFVQLLIENGIDINCKNNNGWNALHNLCRYYDKENLIDIVRLLIEKKNDVNCKTKDGWNALHIVCRHYDHENLIKIVRFLIDNKIDVNCKTKDGVNALHFVCYYQPKSRLVDLVRLLVQHKIDKKGKTTGGDTARSFLLKRFKEDEIKDVLQILDS